MHEWRQGSGHQERMPEEASLGKGQLPPLPLTTRGHYGSLEKKRRSRQTLCVFEQWAQMA